MNLKRGNRLTNISNQILSIFEEKLPEVFGGDKLPRQHQIQLALEVADFLFNKSEKIMFVEAPVGTGKSLAMLVPSALYAKKKKKRIVYATATINLQNQLFEKDTPVLDSVGLITKNQKILAIGKNNYVCKAAHRKNHHLFSDKENRQLDHFFSVCKYGWISELEKSEDNFPKDKLRYISMGKNEEFVDCYENCPGHAHRSEYKRGKYILTITNHDQLIQSFINNQTGKSAILNISDGIVIIDEAQFLKENFLGRIERKISYHQLCSVYLKFRREEFNKYIKKFKKIKSKYVPDESVSNGVRYKIESEEMAIIKKLSKIVENNLTQLTIEYEMNRKFYLEDKIEKLEILDEDLKAFLNEQKNKSWIQFDNNFELHYTALNFNSQFVHLIKTLSKTNKVIIMSGTLTIGDVDTDLRVNWGVKESQYLYYNCPSVFNYREQSIVYIPNNLPHPRDINHLEAVKKYITKIIPLDEGGTLILCTSNEYVSKISTYLKTIKLDRSIFVQGEESVTIISEKFEKDLSSILVGSGSFFTGFSIQGESLSKVILSKLPFPPKDDPYIDLISQGYTEEEKYQLFIYPSMLMKLEQGMGRLIRDRQDKGLIVLMDKRAKKNNISEAINNIGYNIVDDFEAIQNFIQLPKRTFGKNEVYDRNRLNIPKIFFDDSKVNVNANKSIVHYPYKPSDNLTEKIDWLKTFCKIHNNDSPYKGKRPVYKKIQSEREVYQAAVNFLYSKGVDYHIVSDEFMFSNEEHKKMFSRISPNISGPVI